MKTKLNTMRETVAGYLFLMPNLIGFIIFTVFPVIGSLLLSFADWNLITAPKVVGFQNYHDLIGDQVYWRSLINTGIYSVASVSANIFFALLLAVLLNHKIRGIKFFRTAFFLPVVCSSVAMALIWQWLFDYQMGLLNHILSWFKLGPYPWINSPQWALPSVILVSVWKGLGYNMVIFMAALQGVPSELYESAKIDGANGWQSFWNVTWPLISPSTFFVTVTSIINSFQVYDLTTVLTNGGPGNATNTLVMYIFQNAFRFFKMGYASAIAYTLFGIVLVITALQTIAAKRWVHY